MKNNYQSRLFNALSLLDLYETDTRTQVAKHIPALDSDHLANIQVAYNRGAKDPKTLQVVGIIANAYQRLALDFTFKQESDYDDLELFLEYYTGEIAEISMQGRNKNLQFKNIQEELYAYFDVMQESATDRFGFSLTIKETWIRHIKFKLNFEKWINSSVNDKNDKLEFSIKFIENRRHSLEVPQSIPRFISETSSDSIIKTLMFSHRNRVDILKTMKLEYGKRINNTRKNKDRKQTNIILDSLTSKMLDDYLVKHGQKKNAVIAQAIREFIQRNDREISTLPNMSDMKFFDQKYNKPSP